MMVSARQGMPSDAANIHASVIVLGDRGIAITGPSGSGKSALALSLVNHWSASGRFARLVGDDQVFIARRAGRLIAYAPPNIAGWAEVRGLGPIPTRYEPAAIVDCVVDLVAQDGQQRLASGEKVDLAGVAMPIFRLPARRLTAGVATVEAIVASMLRPNDQLPANG